MTEKKKEREKEIVVWGNKRGKVDKKTEPQSSREDCGSVFVCIAHGDVTQSEIEAATGMKSLGGQMKVLEENYGIICKKRPIGAKEGSQTVRFEIQDNFLRNAQYPHKSLIYSVGFQV